jgi:Ca-activated chloride channel homolog
MRKTLAALLLMFANALAAQDERLAITADPLGDSDGGVVTRITFRFPTPIESEEGALLVLQGSFLQNGKVVRNFRYPIEESQPKQVSTVQTFAEGTANVEVRLLQPFEDEQPPLLIVRTAKTFPIAKTGKPYIAKAGDGAEAAFAEGIIPDAVGAVRILPPRRDVAPNLFVVAAEVLPPVQRVEFWVEGKRVVARNAPPYSAELDLGKLPKRVEVRAVGYDAKGRYVDADAFLVNERDTPLEVKISRNETPDGVSHLKLSIQNSKGTNLKKVELYAGDRKIHVWDRPPYALDLPTERLAGAQFIRASVVDETGYEASDLLFLDGARYVEQLDVNLIELPVSVVDKSGAPVPDLEAKDFTVVENGKPQKVSDFNFAANLPLSLGVLLDQSTSMEPRIEGSKAAATQFFRRVMKPKDRAFISSFASEAARGGAPFVSEVATLEGQVAALGKPSGGTALYDAIVTGLYRFRNIQGRKALIVITDGEDTMSRLTYDEMLAYARASRVPLYFIGVGFTIGPGKLKALAEETGGLAFFVRHVSQLDETYARLEQDLRSQYLLGYYSESLKNDQAYRTIEVKVDKADAKVRTIRGFVP